MITRGPDGWTLADIKHGVDGWVLVEMEWYPEDGMACFQYERNVPGVGVESTVTWRPQPVTERHEGWSTRNRQEVVLGYTDCDRIRLERGLYNDPVDVEGYWE